MFRTRITLDVLSECSISDGMTIEQIVYECRNNGSPSNDFTELAETREDFDLTDDEAHDALERGGPYNVTT